MAHLINYIWQSSFCLLFFFGIYWCFLKGEKVFNFTRVFLLVTPVLALLFPLIEIPVEFSKPTISLENTDFLQYLTAQEAREDVVATYGLPEVTVESTKLPILLEWKDYLFLGYLLIVLLLTLRLLWQFLQLRLLAEKGWYQTTFKLKGSYFLIPTFGLAPVFSFFDRLFWDDTQQLKPEEEEQIVRHELEHIRQGHSWDMIYYQILSILFWFNPGIHLMRMALIDTHEFSADANVVKQTANKESYTNLIVKIAFKGLDLPVGNYFIRSKTLKRIMMMKKTEKINWFKLLMVLPLTAMLLGLVSMKTTSSTDFFANSTSMNLANMKQLIEKAQDTISVSTKVIHIPSPTHYEYVSSLKDGKITAQLGDLRYEIGDISDNQEYADVLEMINIFKQSGRYTKQYNIPDLHSTADIMPKPEKGIDEWNRFLSKNLRFPGEARKLGATGAVFVEFVVSKDGKVLQPTIRKSMGMGLDDEVLRIFSLENIPDWNPGMVDGKPINTLMILPIRFKVDGGVAKSKPFFSSSSATDGTPDAFDVVEKMPAPQGGLDGWNNYLSNNLEYPKKAMEMGIEGTVYVTFVVDEDGNTKAPQVMRGIGGGADEEAMRLISNAPKWTPGQQKGVNVPVKMKLPIRFQLDGNNKIKKSNKLNEVVVVGYGAVSEDKSSPSPTIKLNNTGTDKAEQPLFVINGEIYEEEDLSNISSSDIESINVLKAPSSTEKYKDEGKNGVIEITLKQGVEIPTKSKPSSDVQRVYDGLPTLANGKAPLYIIDGEISNAAQLKSTYKPEDIKSISVMKDASSVSIYGSKAANGAILITTKK